MNTLLARLLFVLLLFSFIKSSSLNPRNTISENSSTFKKSAFVNAKKMENYNLFSPKMDYDEWTPMGRGDPLKNDPTFDYMPPVLDKVHYWIDPSKRTPDSPMPNSEVFVSGYKTEPTLSTRSSSTIKYSAPKTKEADSRLDTTSLFDPFIKLMDKAQFGLNFNSNYNYKSSTKRIQRPQYTNNKQQKTQSPQALQRPPYTMLMPPPPPPQPSSSHASTTVTIKSGTFTSVQNRTRGQLVTALPPGTLSSLTSANTTTTINPTVLANTENVFKPVAIAMPGQMEGVISETHSQIRYTTEATKTMTKEDLRTLPYVTVQNKSAVEEHVTELQQSETLNHLEYQTSDRYVSEEKTTYVDKNKETTVKYVDEMMLPEKTYDSTSFTSWNDENASSFRATTTSTITTTKANILTTDPMFKHYKQPLEPIRGPLYLIIQGHSKVKTYGASKNPINRLLTSNEIKYDKDKEKKQKFEKKNRTLHSGISPEKFEEKDSDVSYNGVQSLTKIQNNEKDGLKCVDDTFENSDREFNSKHKFEINRRKKRFLSHDFHGKIKKILSAQRTTPTFKIRENKEKTEESENRNIESLTDVIDDYELENMANISVKQEDDHGSGLDELAI